MADLSVSTLLRLAAAHPVLAVLALLTVALGFFLTRDFAAGWPVRHIPSPPGIPFLGHVLHLTNGKPWINFSKFVNQYGPVYVLRLFSKPFIVIADPKLVKHVFMDNKESYVKDMWSYDYFKDILGRGLVTSDGAIWKAHRAVMKPAFQVGALRRLSAIFDAAAGRFIADIDKGCKGAPLPAHAAAAAAGKYASIVPLGPGGAPLSRSDTSTVPLGGGAALIEVASHFRQVTLEVISQIALGFDPAQANVFPTLFEAVLDELNLRPYQPHRQFLPHIELPHRRKLGQLNAIVSGMIAARRAARRSAVSAGAGASAAAEVSSSSSSSVSGRSRAGSGSAKGLASGAGAGAGAVPAAAAASAAAPDDGSDISGEGGVSVTGREMFAGGKGDMLDMILDAQESSAEGQSMDDGQIADELKTQLLAGHETSSMLLTWTVYLLAKYPAVYAKVQAEVDAKLGKVTAGSAAASATPSFDAFKGLAYLECVMKEAMRVYTPVPILNRECVEEDVLRVDDEHAYVVPKGTAIIVSVWALHQSRELWGEDVAEFKPERFEKVSQQSKELWGEDVAEFKPERFEKVSHQSRELWGEDVAEFKPERFEKGGVGAKHPWAYMPFSLGERNCIGQNLAMMEAKVVLGSLLRRFTVALPPDQPAAVTDSFIIPVRPQERLNLIVKPRV